MLSARKCLDCAWRWTPVDTGTWKDDLECPRCGSDETVGEATVARSLEEELAVLAGRLDGRTPA